MTFQSTLPAGGATNGDIGFTFMCYLFQSTLPAGGATKKMTPYSPLFTFQSTLPAGGATKQLDKFEPV